MCVVLCSVTDVDRRSFVWMNTLVDRRLLLKSFHRDGGDVS